METQAVELSSILIFAAAIAVATATPGPTLITLVARMLAAGAARNLSFALGLILGDVLWLGCAVFGIAALASQVHEIMVVLKYLGAAYLLWLASKLWTATPATGAAASAGRVRSWGAVGGGLAVAAANPKTMMFYLALLPNLVDVGAIDAATFLELSGLLGIIYAAVLAAYMTAAMRARRLFASPRALRAANRTSSVLMAGTAAFVASRA